MPLNQNNRSTGRHGPAASHTRGPHETDNTPADTAPDATTMNHPLNRPANPNGGNGRDDGPRRIALFGECLIELRGEPLGELRQGFGGDTLNTAVYLARLGTVLGLRAGYATGLGDDPYSDAMLARWEAEQVGTSLVRRLPERLPGLYAIHLDPNGERRFAYWRGESAARDYFRTDETTPLERAAPALDAFYFSGISLAILDAPSRERLLGVARRVRAAGGRVCFDSNYRPRLWKSPADAVACHARACAGADIALVTLDDEALLHGTATPAQTLDRCLALPAAEVVVRRGAQPVVLRLPGEAPFEVATTPVAQVVDTTAAGDAFAAGYIGARLAGRDGRAAAQLGNRLAAVVIQHPGAIVPGAVTAPLLEELRAG